MVLDRRDVIWCGKFARLCEANVNICSLFIPYNAIINHRIGTVHSKMLQNKLETEIDNELKVLKIKLNCNI